AYVRLERLSTRKSRVPDQKATEIAPEIRTYWQRFCRLCQSSGKTVQNWTRSASILKDTGVELRHPADDRGLRSAVKVPASRSVRLLGRYSNGRGWSDRIEIPRSASRAWRAELSHHRSPYRLRRPPP